MAIRTVRNRVVAASTIVVLLAPCQASAFDLLKVLRDDERAKPQQERSKEQPSERQAAASRCAALLCEKELRSLGWKVVSRTKDSHWSDVFETYAVMRKDEASRLCVTLVSHGARYEKPCLDLDPSSD